MVLEKTLESPLDCNTVGRLHYSKIRRWREVIFDNFGSDRFFRHRQLRLRDLRWEGETLISR